MAKSKKKIKKQNKSAGKSAAPVKENQRDTATGASYDEAPYESYAYPFTHPAHQALVARLFGVATPDLHTARVLEIGCAGGGNLLPLAHDFPKAEFVGIDLSPVQIAEANTHKKALELKNVKFEAMDIMDFPKSWGKFDYIICHGVFSWVPEFVREKILDVCRQHLSKNGLACISYNVMPGWGPLRSIREMMMIHTKKFDDPAKKVAQAKYLIEFLDKYMAPGSTMHKAIHDINEKFKENVNDSYILHEYLESNNNPFFFNEFAEMIGRHDLQYIGDSTLSLMYTGNFPPDADKILKQVADNITKEQYIDFLSNRQFRYSVIAGKEAQIKGAGLDVLDDMYFSCDLVLEEEKAGQPLKFRRPNSDFSIDVGDPIVAILLKEMTENRHTAYNLKEMVALVTGKTNAFTPEQVEKFLRSHLILYSFKSIFRPGLLPSTHTQTISKKPKAYPIAMYQAGLPRCTALTTASYSVAKLSALEMAFLRHLDGHKTYDQIVKKVLESIGSGAISISQNNVPVTDPKKQQVLLEENISNILKKIAKFGLLVS